MLDTLFLEVFNKILNGNIFSVECDNSMLNNKRVMLYITTVESITEEEFIQNVRSVIPKENISFSDGFCFNIDLTEEIINNVIIYAKSLCFNEFYELNKK